MWQSLPEAVFIRTIAESVSPISADCRHLPDELPYAKTLHRLLAQKPARHVEIVDRHVAELPPETFK